MREVEGEVWEFNAINGSAEGEEICCGNWVGSSEVGIVEGEGGQVFCSSWGEGSDCWRKGEEEGLLRETKGDFDCGWEGVNRLWRGDEERFVGEDRRWVVWSGAAQRGGVNVWEEEGESLLEEEEVAGADFLCPLPFLMFVEMGKKMHVCSTFWASSSLSSKMKN